MSSFTYNYQHAVNQTNTIFYDSVITTRRLYYLTIPLQAEYYLGHNFSIGAGGSVSYLLGSSGYATTYQQADNNPPTNVKQYSQNIQLSGYNKVNADIRVYGRWLINRHWSMIVMYYNGITDMKNNSFFGENLIERNKGFQFLAAYSF